MDVDELSETFSFFDDWEDKYRFIIDLGKDLTDLDSNVKIEDNLIRGCQSQVWLIHKVMPNGSLQFGMDSDAFIVRGLISIVLCVYNNKPPREILDFDIEAFFAQLELLSHLSQTRGNGLRAMISRIREIAERAYLLDQ